MIGTESLFFAPVDGLTLVEPGSGLGINTLDDNDKPPKRALLTGVEQPLDDRLLEAGLREGLRAEVFARGALAGLSVNASCAGTGLSTPPLSSAGG